MHVISFDNPWPPSYGGVIDVYYKLRALKDLGVRITLHAYEYGRKPDRHLNEICEKVYYYERRTFVNPFIGSLPYIVSTRNGEELLQNLLKDKSPILFEGLHTCYFLTHKALAGRHKVVRMHNIEHDYYRKLEEVESNFFKKYFFSKEAARLESFEHVLERADVVAAISVNDQTTLESRYERVVHLPPFHANNEITAMPGRGDYVFYHGNLSVGENDEAARYLVTEVFANNDIPFYIAGNKPSSALRNLVEGRNNIRLFNHLSTGQISELIAKAHINILPTFQSTGIKLKLINVLYQGRFAVCNSLMVCNTGVEDLCHIADDPVAMLTEVQMLMKKKFTAHDVQKRVDALRGRFNNETNARELLSLMELLPAPGRP
jgi:hypothetical protein